MPSQYLYTTGMMRKEDGKVVSSTPTYESEATPGVWNNDTSHILMTDHHLDSPRSSFVHRNPRNIVDIDSDFSPDTRESQWDSFRDWRGSHNENKININHSSQKVVQSDSDDDDVVAPRRMKKAVISSDSESEPDTPVRVEKDQAAHFSPSTDEEAFELPNLIGTVTDGKGRNGIGNMSTDSVKALTNQEKYGDKFRIKKSPSQPSDKAELCRPALNNQSGSLLEVSGSSSYNTSGCSLPSFNLADMTAPEMKHMLKEKKVCKLYTISRFCVISLYDEKFLTRVMNIVYLAILKIRFLHFSSKIDFANLL